MCLSTEHILYPMHLKGYFMCPIAHLKHPKEEGTSFSLSVTRKLALEEVKLPKSQVIIVQTSAFSLI